MIAAKQCVVSLDWEGETVTASESFAWDSGVHAQASSKLQFRSLTNVRAAEDDLDAWVRKRFDNFRRCPSYRRSCMVMVWTASRSVCRDSAVKDDG